MILDRFMQHGLEWRGCQAARKHYKAYGYYQIPNPKSAFGKFFNSQMLEMYTAKRLPVFLPVNWDYNSIW